MLQHVSDSFTVDSIMTGQKRLKKLKKTEDPSTMQEEVRELQINQLPIVENGSVVGMMIADPEDRTLPEVGNYEPIAPKWLVSADTSIRKLIDILDSGQHPARFVFQGNKVVGLVTYADLNKTLVRTALYSLISQLEIKLARLLRHHPKSTEELTRYLSQSRQEDLKEKRMKMAEKDVAADLTEKFYLTDLFTIIGKIPDLYEKLGYQSRSKFDEATSGINGLRRRVAHPVRLIIDDIDSVEMVNRRCDRIENLLSDAPDKEPALRV